MTLRARLERLERTAQGSRGVVCVLLAFPTTDEALCGGKQYVRGNETIDQFRVRVQREERERMRSDGLPMPVFCSEVELSL